MQHREGSLEGAGNAEIFFQYWSPEHLARGVILIVHGAAEHSGRYARFAEHFVRKGYACAAFDHIGHGRSQGTPGYIRNFADYIETLDRFCRQVQRDFPDTPLVLLGHSMGGLISSCYLLQNQGDFAGCVLSGPAIKTDLQPPWWQRTLIRFFSLVLPKTGVLQLDASGVSRDPLEVQQYLDDPLVYGGKLSARKVSQLFAAMEWIQEQVAEIHLPLLLLHGSEDTLTSPSGSRFLYDKVSSSDKTLKIYPGLFHEIFNEPERADVFADIEAWLDSRIERRRDDGGLMEGQAATAQTAGTDGGNEMTRTVEIQVKRDEITSTRAREDKAATPGPGQVVVAIDKFALTANNVTYAVAGDMVGYWQFYPAPEGWGIVPVWGIGEVVMSDHPAAAVGERLYGFFPMASHAVLTLNEGAPQHFMEISAHRAELPAVYNSYRRIAAEPEVLQAMEEERCLYFPLFMTSYLIFDFLMDQGLYGAEQVLIGSASSKTAFGLASLLHGSEDCSASVVGLTSPGNREFVEGLGFYDQVICYGDETEFDSTRRSVYVDMSGDTDLTARVHGLLGDGLAYSCAVGATHWQKFDGEPTAGPLPGPEPEFFFAPAQIEKRDQEWGSGVIMNRAAEAVAGIVNGIAGDVEIQRIKDAESAMAAWVDLVENRVPPSRGLLLSLLP